MMRRVWLLAPLTGAVLYGGVAIALESLGVFNDWGAFEDPVAGRCYAIAKAQPDPRHREREAFMTITTAPKQRIAGQLYWRLSRTPLPSSPLGVRIARTYVRLKASGANAWAQDARGDAAIRSALRGAQQLSVVYRDSRGRRYSDKYRLAGAATAIDAAALACANLR